MNRDEKAGRGRFAASCRGIIVTLLVVLGMFTAAAEPVRTQAGHSPLIGEYTLVKYSGHGHKPTGRLSYDSSGRMWIMLLPPGRNPITRLSKPYDFRRTMRRVVAYYGTYHIEENTGRVIHHVEEASNPAWIGEDFIRWYRFDGPNLVLSLSADFKDPLAWERLSESPDSDSQDN